MRNCIICNSNKKIEYFDSSVIVPLPYPINGKQKIVQCEKCGFIFSDSDNTVEDYQQYYTTLNKHKKRAADAESLDKIYYEKIYKYFTSLNKDSCILDFGSGDLLMKNILSEKGYKNIFTFDVDSGMDYKNEFDLIISTHTFEHILNADIVFKKLTSYLKNKGQLLLAVPDIEGYVNCYCGPYNWFDLEHINHFSAISLKNFVKANNLSVISCVRDKREVRPGLFYPEIIIHCVKNDLENQSSPKGYEYDKSNIVLQNYIEKSENDFNKAFKLFQEISYKKVVIWGFGITAMRMIYHLDNFDNIDADLVDSNSRLWGKTLLGKKILSPKELSGRNLDETVFIVLAVNFNDIIKAIKNQFGQKVKICNIIH
jgi:hypothetical protein